MNAKPKPSRLAEFLDKRIDQLVSKKNQVRIAQDAGFANPNMITMLKKGHTKLALDRVPAMAKALEVDKHHLMSIALEQFFDGKSLDEMREMLSSSVTENELAIIKVIRKASKNSDPSVEMIGKDRITELCSERAA